MNTPKRKVLFRFRAFVSLTVAPSFFAMAISDRNDIRPSRLRPSD
mgnify:CR=1 FL=1